MLTFDAMKQLRSPRAARAAIADHLFRRSVGEAGTRRHLDETMNWVYRAHDATPDDGLSRGYNLARGWGASYPETTGYMIPTLYDYAQFACAPEAAARAHRMAIWECAIQLPSGAVQAGLIDAPVVQPTVFNTGQVIFGWVRAYAETAAPEFSAATARAADWLVACQDADGEWREHQSPLVTSGAVNTYNTRTAWALLEAYEQTGNAAYRRAALANIDRAVAKQQPNGWFPDACLSDNRRPLLHTIAYTIEGILAVATRVGRADYLDASVRATDAVLATMGPGGWLPGRLDAAWRPAARWACVTGVAQMAVVAFRLFRATGRDRYRRAGVALNGFLKTSQNLTTDDLAVRGAMKGSHPHTGGYCPFDYLNWAAKFFADALMLELTCPANATDGGADA